MIPRVRKKTRVETYYTAVMGLLHAQEKTIREREADIATLQRQLTDLKENQAELKSIAPLMDRWLLLRDTLQSIPVSRMRPTSPIKVEQAEYRTQILRAIKRYKNRWKMEI